MLTVGTQKMTLAHPGGHEGPQKVVNCAENLKCTKSEMSEAGTFVFQFLAESGRLPENWDKNSTPVSTKKMVLRDQDIWVVNFVNQKLSGSQKNLHIMISQEGYLIGATSDISNLKEKENYDTFIGLLLIFIFSLIAYTVIFRNKKNAGAGHS